jgi:hypothetical protein
MRRLLVRGVSQALTLALAPMRRAFVGALCAPRTAQDLVLRSVVDGLSTTHYGRAHGILRDDGYTAFRDKLPVVEYDDLAPWVERQMREEGSILVPGPVSVYEKTSGSSGPAKYVPYTAALRRTFDRMFRLWLADLFAHGPKLVTGRAWISVSPRLDARETTPRGVPVGLASDLDYLDSEWRWLLRRFLVLPPALERMSNSETLKRVLAAHLVTGRPEVISVWSPSFVAVLLDWIAEHRRELLADCRARVVRVGRRVFPLPGLAPGIVGALERDPIEWRLVFPDLKLISCWADGPSAPAAAHLHQRLPWAILQPKGLVATEAPITLPLGNPAVSLPLITEVFLELADDAGGIHRIDEVEAGTEYSVVVTAPGGFTRYRLGDRVRVAERFGGTPSLVFVGREGDISDLVGEKLSERFVRSALGALPLGGTGFRALVPLHEPDGRGRYVLLLEHAPATREGLSDRLDALLQEAHRYREARRLGQLDAPTLVVLPGATDRLLDVLEARGIRRGAIKPTCLVRDPQVGRQLLA